MKTKKTLFFCLPLLLLTSCSNTVQQQNSFYFDTFVNTQLFEGEKSDLNNLNQIYSSIDKLADNYISRNVSNIYKINHTNEIVHVDEDLYDLLSKAFSPDLASLNYFNPLCGSLSKKWKESLSNNQVLDSHIIQEELTKMASSSLTFLGDNNVQRNGEAEIDLGAVAKGYVLDLAKKYLEEKGYTKFLINAGSSSILLGEKTGGKDFVVDISELDNSYLKLKNCFVSTSSHSRQQTVIENKVYSHIINPVTGSAINENDAVIVISDSGYLGDILSTAFINESVSSIKNLEEEFNVKTLVIKNRQIFYKNSGIEVFTK